MAIKVNIDGKSVEVSEDSLELPEGYGLITPDNVPKGYFNEDAVNKIVKENVNKTKERVKSDLLDDTDFQKSILSRFNIQLGEDGKPKGLKPTVDVDEVKQNITKELSSEWEGKVNNLKSELEKRNKAVIESSIMSTVNGNWKEDWTKPFDGEPLAISKYRDKFIVDDEGKAALKDPENGGIKYKGDGNPMRPEDYLLDEQRFGELFADKRQRSTGTNAGGKNARKYSDEEISNMSDEEYEANREDILASMG